MQAIQNLMLDTPPGQTVRLADVATITVRPTPNSIEREDGSRRLDVSANVEGDLGSVVGQLQEKLEDVKFDQGYHAEILGEWQERESAQRILSRRLRSPVALIFSCCKHRSAAGAPPC